MNRLYVPLLVLALLCLRNASSEPHFAAASAADSDNAANGNSAHQNTLLADAENEARAVGADPDPFSSDKRVERYAFGLGRRAFTYTTGGGSGGNGVKRLPVYNFGLGKRARPYSFGLGKRAEYDEDHYEDNSSNGGTNGGGDFERNLALYGGGPYAANFMDEKRSRPYSFGLGKRSDGMEDVARRGYPNRYGFGLGRR